MSERFVPDLADLLDTDKSGRDELAGIVVMRSFLLLPDQYGRCPSLVLALCLDQVERLLGVAWFGI